MRANELGPKKPKTHKNTDAYCYQSIIHWSFTEKLSWLYQLDL